MIFYNPMAMLILFALTLAWDAHGATSFGNGVRHQIPSNIHRTQIVGDTDDRAHPRDFPDATFQAMSESVLLMTDMTPSQAAEANFKGICTATVVKRNGQFYSVSAAHCIGPRYNECEKFYYVRNFERDPRGPRIFHKCEGRVLLNTTLDIAIHKLSQPINSNRTNEELPSIELNIADEVSVGDPLVMMGHPSGMLKRITDNCSIRQISRHTDLLLTDCDSFRGNSGSLVFNARTKKMLGILIRATRATDLREDGQPYAVRYSPDLGSTKLTSLPVLKRMIEATLDYQGTNTFLNLSHWSGSVCGIDLSTDIKICQSPESHALFPALAAQLASEMKSHGLNRNLIGVQTIHLNLRRRFSPGTQGSEMVPQVSMSPSQTIDYRALHSPREATGNLHVYIDTIEPPYVAQPLTLWELVFGRRNSSSAGNANLNRIPTSNLLVPSLVTVSAAIVDYVRRNASSRNEQFVLNSRVGPYQLVCVLPNADECLAFQVKARSELENLIASNRPLGLEFIAPAGTSAGLPANTLVLPQHFDSESLVHLARTHLELRNSSRQNEAGVRVRGIDIYNHSANRNIETILREAILEVSEYDTYSLVDYISISENCSSRPLESGVCVLPGSSSTEIRQLLRLLYMPQNYRTRYPQ